jgi:hypothetical protein
MPYGVWFSMNTINRGKVCAVSMLAAVLKRRPPSTSESDSSSSDDDLLIVAALASVVAAASVPLKLPRHRDAQGSRWTTFYEPMLYDTLRPGVDFRKHFRLTPELFLRICDGIRDRVEYRFVYRPGPGVGLAYCSLLFVSGLSA